MLNLVRPAQRQIPLKHQKALWYIGKQRNGLVLTRFHCIVREVEQNYESGLRGAMAFALALQSVHELPEGHGQTIFTATTAIVVLTVGKLIFI